MPRCILILPLLLLAGLARGEDWPEFRGPTGQGLAKGEKFPVSWSATENAWAQEVPGSGWSSPVVVSGKVYLTSAIPVAKSQELGLATLCFTADSGKLEWNTEVFRQGAKAPKIHDKNSHASPTPLVHEGRIYVHFGHQGTACLDTTGKVLWRNRDYKYAPVHGNGGSPALVDGLLVFSTDGASKRELIALDAATGKEKWKTKRSGSASRQFSFSTPLVITVAGKKQIISPGSDMVGAYDPANGKEIWRVRYTGYSVIPRPIHGEGLVFLATGYNTPSVLAIRPDGKGDVTDTHVAWTLRKGAPHTPSLLLVGKELYMISDGGIATCVEAQTGEVLGTKRLGGNGYSASPVFADGKIYFMAENGIGTVVKAGKEFEQVAKNDLREKALASPAFADGAVYIRTESKLYRVGK